MLSLLEKMMLAAIDERKNKITWRSHNLVRFGLKGAVVLKLAELNKIRIENKKIVVIDESYTGDDILDFVLKHFSDTKRPLRLSSWIYGYSANNKEIKNRALNRLEDKGIITQEETRVLVFFTISSYIISGSDKKAEVSKCIHDAFFKSKDQVAKDDAFLASLITICGFTKPFLSGQEIKESKEKIKLIKKGEYYPIENNTLKEVIKAVGSAIASQTAAVASAGT
ncbi:MAG: GPP34 family phosphoprotein [Clostridia bacterium]|nr:GPP34 family phosphoprotein [Clostridia bacterium]